MALTMRLKAEGVPNPLDCRPGDLGFSRHGAGRPVGAAFGFGLEGFTNEFGNLLVRDGPRSTRPQLIMKALDPLFQESPAPQAHGLGAVSDFLGDGFIGCAFSSHDDDSGPGHQPIGKGA